jgi:HSP20 family protein
MLIARWTPQKNVIVFHTNLIRSANETGKPVTRQEANETRTTWNPAADIYDTDQGMTIKVELPGVDKKDIKVNITEDVLTLKGVRINENATGSGKFLHQERFNGEYKRSFNLPTNTYPAKVKATYQQGILTLTIPEPEKKPTKQIPIH